MIKLTFIASLQVCDLVWLSRRGEFARENFFAQSTFPADICEHRPDIGISIIAPSSGQRVPCPSRRLTQISQQLFLANARQLSMSHWILQINVENSQLDTRFWISRNKFIFYGFGSHRSSRPAPRRETEIGSTLVWIRKILRKWSSKSFAPGYLLGEGTADEWISSGPPRERIQK